MLSGVPRHARSRRGLFFGVVVALVATSAVLAGTSSSAGKQLQLRLSPVSAGALVAQAVQAGQITPSLGSAVSPSGVDTTVLPNVKANTGSQPDNEVPITADPNNGNHLITGGNDYNCGSIQGFHSSDDGGATFTHHKCLDVQSGCSGFGDPAIAYDNVGAVYIMGIDGCSSNWHIVFEKSTNNGSTWSSLATAVNPIFTNGLTDKEWLESDHGASSPRKGALYVSVTQFTSSEAQDAISVSHSYDGGATWATVQVSTTQNTSSSVDQFSDLAVAADGTVYVTWLRCPSTGPTGDCGGTTSKLMISKSTDGGKTWSKEAQIATTKLAPDTCGAYYGCVPGTSERLSDIPVSDVNQQNGNIFVEYYNYTGSFTQTLVRKSTDGGATWGNPKKPAGGKNTHSQWLGWLSVNPTTGNVGVTYNQTTAGTQYNARASVSTDLGAHYTIKKTTSSVTSNTANDGFGGGFIGDYTGNIWAGATLHQSWPDTRTGTAADETGGLIP